MHSGDLQKAAARAVQTLLGYYPSIQASDPQIFVAGMVRVFLSYPQHLWALALDPVKGIPAKHKYAPNIAETVAFFEPVHSEELRRAEMLERNNRRALPEPDRDPVMDKKIAEGLKELAERLRNKTSDYAMMVRMEAK